MNVSCFLVAENLCSLNVRATSVIYDVFNYHIKHTMYQLASMVQFVEACKPFMSWRGVFDFGQCKMYISREDQTRNKSYVLL